MSTEKKQHTQPINTFRNHYHTAATPPRNFVRSYEGLQNGVRHHGARTAPPDTPDPSLLDHDPSASGADSSFPDVPPFPSDVPTCPLVRISLARLLHGDEEEEDRLWRACCELGFFYIDLRAVDPDVLDGGAVGANARQVEVHVDGEQLLEDADRLFEVQKGFFDLPVEEKVKYDFSGEGSYFG